MTLATHNALKAAALPAGATMASRFRLLVALCVATLALGLAGQLPGDATAAVSVASAADLRVGHTVRQIVVPGSIDREERQVEVHLWYPADATESAGPKAVYKSALHGKELIPGPHAPWDRLSWTVEAEIAREGAAIDPKGGPFPVIVFSHGSTNDAIDYAHTLEAIASAGFVVAAPGHTNNTQDDARRDFINDQKRLLEPDLVLEPEERLFNCNDGLAPRRLVPPPPGQPPAPDCSKSSVPFNMADRVRDISKVLDELPVWFGSRVDASRAGVMGHSRGTVTALTAAGGSTAWGIKPLTDGQHPRVKAVMGMAIGVANLTNMVNFTGVTAPTVLVAGGRDRNSEQAVSVSAFERISSADKLFVGIPNATHRSFDSTYCAQLQSAGRAFDRDPDGVVQLSELDTDGNSVVERFELDSARAILDLHTVRLIAVSAVQGISGKAVHYCASEFFTSPVDIRELVGALAGETPGSEFSCSGSPERVCAPVLGPSSVCLTTTIPCTGLETEEVKQGMKDIAVAFFDSALNRTGMEGIHFTRYLAPKWLMKHVPMVGSAQAYAGPGSVCPPGQGVICSDE
jgi:predicted dienelactone hydrolase